MLWKWIFFAVLALGLGAIWQNQETRKMFLSEVNRARVFVNGVAEKYEAWQIMFITAGITIVLIHFYRVIFGNHIYSLGKRTRSFLFRNFRRLPVIRTTIKKQISKALDDMERESFKPKPNEKYRTELPSQGFSHEEIMNELARYEHLVDIEWEKGWVSGGLYYSSAELTKLSTEVFGKYVWTNPLHSEVFPQIRKMEAEVVQWGVKLFHGSSDACGVMTSGGTESIILAMKCYREIGYEKGIEYPEIVCSESAHCAFNKAACYLRMKLVMVSYTVTLAVWCGRGGGGGVVWLFGGRPTCG